MALREYNIKNTDMGNENSFQWLHENVIVHYDVVEGLQDFNKEACQENSKEKEVLRPTIDSVK